MAGPNTQQREQARALDQMFPGQRLTGYALQGTDVASVNRNRSGAQHVSWLPEFNQPIIENRLNVYRDRGFDYANTEDREAYRRLLQSTAGNPHMAAELAEYRQFELQNSMMASQFALAPFQSINLSGGELPMIVRPRPRNHQRFTIRSIGQDGGARQDHWRETKSIETFEMEMLSTDKIEYPIFDIQQGNVDRSRDVQEHLRYDMDMKIDELALANIIAAKQVSGLRDLLDLHPLIVAANLPDKNYLNLNATEAGKGGVLTITKLKTIINHIAQFSAITSLDGEMRISSMFYSPQNIRDSWDFIDLVSGIDGTGVTDPAKTVPTPVREQIFNTGMMTSAWGHSWKWVPNNRIDKGRLYIFTNKPIGWVFTKTEFDKVITWDGPDQQEQNYGQVVWRRCLVFVLVEMWAGRVVIVDL